jgi:hypothetical protein
MNRTSLRFVITRLRSFAPIAIMLTVAGAAYAQKPGSVTFEYRGAGQVTITVHQRIDNRGGNPPMVRLYEAVGTGDAAKLKYVTLDQPPAMSAFPAEGTFEVTLRLPTPSNGFVRYEVDISNYVSGSDDLNFRAAIPTAVRAEIVSAPSRDQVKLKFYIPGNTPGGCGRAKEWILRALGRNANSKIRVSGSEGAAAEEYSIVGAQDGNVIGGLAPAGEIDPCTFETNATLERKLPAAETLNPTMLVFDKEFLNSQFTLVEHPSFAGLRDGVKGSLKTPTGPAEAEKRDDERKGVFEVGGGLTTAKQKEGAADLSEDRETSGFVDLRLALNTRYYFERGSRGELSSWWSWTPAQFDATISEGQLLGKNLTTNTMRLFTQAQFVKNITPRESDGTRDASDFIALNLEGGAAADRDLRVIDYTGAADFQWEPGYLNQTFGRSDADETPAILFTLSPVGVELGGRQVRRDPFFEGADAFIRRYRFGVRAELQLPPFAQFTVENRFWVRGEVDENRFRNYFKTSLNLFPRRLNENVSAGIFLSYEAGSLPPFSTPAVATFKVGFRVRGKHW